MGTILNTGPMAGDPPTLEWLPLGRLQVDTAYQRGIDTPQSRRILVSMVKRWDWRLCQPLNVSRRADGTLFIVDGQHRLEGARMRGDVPHLPCVVTSHTDTADEAQTFVALNLRRQKLSQGNVFAASLASGDDDAKRALQLIEGAGFTLARNHDPSTWKAGELFCGPAVQQAVKVQGEAVVKGALNALSEAYTGEVQVRGATLLQSLYVIFADDAKQRGFDRDRFVQALGSVEQRAWLDRASQLRQQHKDLSWRDATAMAIMDAYTAFGRAL